MKRRVFLELADNTTDTHCGDCDARSVDQNEGVVFCFYGPLGRHKDPFAAGDTRRLTGCVENEKIAAKEAKDAELGAFARDVSTQNLSHLVLGHRVRDYLEREKP